MNTNQLIAHYQKTAASLCRGLSKNLLDMAEALQNGRPLPIFIKGEVVSLLEVLAKIEVLGRVSEE